MPARFTAYPADAVALQRLLEPMPRYRLGRAAECELCIDHPSVSRFHAELQHDGAAWVLRDTASKNGLRVDGRPVGSARIERATWFALGDVYCFLEPLDAAAAQTFRAQREARRSVSQALSAQIDLGRDAASLLPQTLDAVLELSALERGFVLYGENGADLRVRASRGIGAGDIAAAAFAGSVAAVERCQREGRSLVCCDTAHSPWLGARPSVRLGGIRALACVPLHRGDQRLGVIYADSQRPGPVLTELDLELLENLAEHASAALAAAQIQAELQQLLRAADAAGLAPPRWSELRAAAPS